MYKCKRNHNIAFTIDNLGFFCVISVAFAQNELNMNIIANRNTWLLAGLLACLLLVVLTVHSCAVQAAPLGGPKDTIPPYPDSLKSSPNEQLRFKKQDIELSFNEWVTLKNQNQIIVSPPLATNLKAKVKGKKVIVEFDEEEVLRENTTYTINFGESIVDYTEGNPLQNYTFVFSTGDYIDSLSIAGVVTNDFTGKAEENVMVSLYDNLQDSVIYNERPLYFAKTDKSGRFRINNIRQDSFRLFVLDDKNVNYLKDQESEGMGFFPDTIILSDSVKSIFELPFFVPDPKLRKTGIEHKYGQLTVIFNRDPFDLSFRFEPYEPGFYETTISKDTLLAFYNTNADLNLILELGNEKEDTIALIRYSDSLEYSKKPRIIMKNASQRIGLGTSDSIKLTFNHPVEIADQKRIMLLDSAETEVPFTITKASNDPRTLIFYRKWKEGNPYTLIIDSTALKNHFEMTNDSIGIPFVVSSNATKGEIIFELDSLNENFQYLVQLSQGKKTIEKLVSGEKTKKLSYLSLNAGQYIVRIIEDKNKNGRWDPGDYNSKRQSEKWIEKKLESLKAGWTLEVSVNGSEFN